MATEQESQASEQPAPTESPQGDVRSQSEEFNAAYDRDSLLGNLPEGYDKDKFSKYLDKTADPYVAFKNYSNLEKMKSKGMPNEAWDESDWAALDAARGVPDSPDKYEFGEEVQLDEDSAKFIKDFAAKTKLTPAQATEAAGLLQSVRQLEAQQAEEKKEAATENMISYLQDQWGHPDGQSYQNNFKLVSGVLESIGIKEDSPEADAIWSGPPQVVSLLKEYADMLDPAVVSSWGVGDTATPRSIQENMDKIMIDMMKYEIGSKEHTELNAKWDRLHAQKERMGV